jgi:hypothetical protein
MPSLTRGPLPAGVYWRRRIFVLLLAGSLVFVIASVLSGGSDGDSDDTPVAQQAAGQVEASETVTIPPRQKGGKRHKARRTGATQGPTFDPGVLVEPDGNCDPADVRVTPEVAPTDAGDPVTVGLSLQTIQAEACYFRVGPDKVTVRITDGGTEIWTSRECSGAVPDESIVVRRVVATVVQMTWDARESDADCSKRRDWVRWGDFTIAAAALGGEPAETAFELTKPTPETVTIPPKTDKDEQDRRDGDRRKQRDRDQDARGQQDDPNDWQSQDADGAGGNDEPTR